MTTFMLEMANIELQTLVLTGRKIHSISRNCRPSLEFKNKTAEPRMLEGLESVKGGDLGLGGTLTY